MFTPDFYIEMFQSSKRMATNQIFKDERLNKVANDFIDAQTVFAKMMAKNTIEMLSYTADSMSKAIYPQGEETVKAKTAKKSAKTDTDITQGD